MNSRIRNRRLALSLAAILLLGAPLAAQTPSEAPPPPVDPSQAIDEALHAIETGDLQRADKLIRDVATTNPKMSRLQLASGMLMIELKRYTDAVEALGRYNDTDEGRRDFRGWAALGSVYLRSYMYSSAVDPLEKALSLVPPDGKHGEKKAQIALNLARTHLGLKDRKDAIEAIKSAEESAPQDGGVQADVCELASRAGNEDLARAAGNAAIRAYNAELNVNPLSIPAHRGLSRCYNVLFSLQSVKLNKNPNDGEAFIEGARLLKSIGDTERRIRLLDAHNLVLQALDSSESSKSNAEWQLLAAELEIDLGATTEATARINAVLNSDQDNAEAQKLKKRLLPSAG